MTIDVAMIIVVFKILIRMCHGYNLIILSFPLILPLLGIILVLFMVGTTCLPFIVACIF